MKSTPRLLQPANITWNESQQPWAKDFDDCYFSRENGLAETEHVFINGNQLRQRWKTLTANSFTIAETGFGSGLNFIATWQLWGEIAPANTHLYFVSAELHPLCKADLRKAADLWPDLQPYYHQLIEQYPPLTAGFHVLNFSGVTLLLMLGDAEEMFSQLLLTTHPDFLPYNGKIDAWFLDGFAPAKNPDLWTANICGVIALLSRPGATLATFSAAGEVRRHLAMAGFEVRKEKGFHHKRDMTCATFIHLSETAQIKSTLKPQTPWHISSADNINTLQEVTILGAGIMGCTLAYCLAQKGFAVTVIDAKPKAALEASGNQQAMLYGKFSAREDTFSQFNLASYLYALQFYQQLAQQHPALPIYLCGLLQLAWCEKEKIIQNQLQDFFNHTAGIARVVTIEEASALAGIPLSHPGLFFSQAGWMHPAPVCDYLLKHPRIQTRFSTSVISLQHEVGQYQTRQHETGQWLLLDDKQQILHSTSQLVLACGHRSLQFPETRELPLKLIRGQISHVKPTPLSRQLKTVISGNGYIAPAHGDTQSLGATYTPQSFDLQTQAKEHQHNLEQLHCHAPSLANEWSHHHIQDGRAHFRAATPDYFPLCGPLPERSGFLQNYGALRKNAYRVIPEAGTYLPGLWICAGLGSRGMTYAPLCAEVLASYLTHSPAPLPHEVMLALHPARFTIRDLVKNRS